MDSNFRLLSDRATGYNFYKAFQCIHTFDDVQKPLRSAQNDNKNLTFKSGEALFWRRKNCGIPAQFSAKMPLLVCLRRHQPSTSLVQDPTRGLEPALV